MFNMLKGKRNHKNKNYQKSYIPRSKTQLFEKKPEFNFSKIVQSAPPKPETKTFSTQFHENDFKITDSSKVIIARKPKPSASSRAITSNSQTSTTSNIDKKQLQQNAKLLKAQQIASSRIAKGSEDPIQRHNRFGTLAEDHRMDISEGAAHSGVRSHRSRSPITTPK